MKRSDMNRAIREWNEFVKDVAALDIHFQEQIRQGRFGSGEAFHKRGELGVMEGTPGPSYSDPTGDEAVAEEKADPTHKTIEAMAEARDAGQAFHVSDVLGANGVWGSDDDGYGSGTW